MQLPLLQTTEQSLATTASIAPVAQIREPELVVHSNGLGQDSFSILLLLIHNKEFRKIYAPNRLISVFSDTGNEFPSTYQHKEETRQLCEKHGIEFYCLDKESGWHSEAWPDLKAQYRRNSTCGSAMFTSSSCTHNLKISPIYNWLEHYLAKNYGTVIQNKKGYYSFAQKYGKISVLVGISRGEEKRVANPANEKMKYKRDNVEIRYPLLDMGMDRRDCQVYIESMGHTCPRPSNCMLCHYASPIEIMALARFYQKEFEEWCEIEAAKLRKNAHKGEKNYGVYKKGTLREMLAAAIAKYGHMTDEEVNEYCFSHGHCQNTSY